MSGIDLYRVFPWDQKSNGAEAGAPFFVPRASQGQGRHDIPELDGVLYCSRQSVSAIAEFLQGFRGQRIGATHLERPDDLVNSLVHFQLPVTKKLVDLDDPQTLTKLKIRPSQILTRNREVTRAISARIHRDGAAGILWPSALESAWTNASLFTSRTVTALTTVKILPLTIDLVDLREAASVLGVLFT